jgi:hypothetical protein
MRHEEVLDFLGRLGCATAAMRDQGEHSQKAPFKVLRMDSLTVDLFLRGDI